MNFHDKLNEYIGLIGCTNKQLSDITGMAPPIISTIFCLKKICLQKIGPKKIIELYQPTVQYTSQKTEILKMIIKIIIKKLLMKKKTRKN